MAREPLFNLAVTRALTYAERTGIIKYQNDTSALEKALQPWYLKTRFAYRIPLKEIVKAMQDSEKNIQKALFIENNTAENQVLDDSLVVNDKLI